MFGFQCIHDFEGVGCLLFFCLPSGLQVLSMPFIFNDSCVQSALQLMHHSLTCVF